MIEFILLIPVFTLLLVLLSAIKFQRILNPLSMIVFWWAFWLWVSNFSLTGFFVPGARTQAMVMIMVLAVFLGSLLATGKIREREEVARLNDRIVQNERYVFAMNLALVPVIVFFFVRALPVLLSSDPVVYRSLAYSGIDRPESAFRSGYQAFLFHLVVSPVIFFSVIVGIVLFFDRKKKRLLLVSLTLFLLEAVLILGRFNFYHLGIFILLAFLFLAQRKKPAVINQETDRTLPAGLRKGKFRILLATAAILAVLLALSLYRGERNVGLLRTLTKVTVDYHTVGLVLFDQELSNPFSRLNTRRSYGRSSLGGIDSLIVVMLRRFNRTIVPMAGESGLYFDEQRVVGEDREGRPIKGNAFFTILYSLYFDGRYLFVIALPFVFGYLVSSHYLNWLKNGSLDRLILLILFLYLGFFSLFQSPLEGVKFWFSLFLVLWMKNFGLGFLKKNGSPDE